MILIVQTWQQLLILVVVGQVPLQGMLSVVINSLLQRDGEVSQLKNPSSNQLFSPMEKFLLK
jgi:hypothetical protein